MYAAELEKSCQPNDQVNTVHHSTGNRVEIFGLENEEYDIDKIQLSYNFYLYAIIFV